MLHLNRHLDNDEDDESLDLMLKALRRRRKIVVVAGAGISVSAGIPDFRSSHGLFRTLKDEHKLKASGKQLFDASVYKNDSSTESFHNMVRSLSNLSAKAHPTPFHRLLARLAKEDRLLRLYSQNVDGIECTLPPLATQVPLNHKAPWPKTIQLHGGLEKMVCHKCKQISKFDPEMFTGPVPPLCQACEERDSVRTTYAGKRSHGIGRLRPRIVLYNETNPDEDAIGAVVASDLRARPDAVIVVGTSLKIPPVRRIVKEMCLTARGRQNGITMMINKENMALGKDLEDCFDVLIEGESDEVAQIANLKDWDDNIVDEMEEITASDVEKAKARQRPFSVVVETPKKNKIQTSLMSNGIMTPPISIDEELSDSKGSEDGAITTKVKNPASIGRSIADVLGQSNKENQQKKSKTKSMLKTVTKTSKSTTKKAQKAKKNPATSQSKITARVSKPNQSAVTVSVKSSKPPSKDHTTISSSPSPYKPFDPVRPEAHRNNASTSVSMFPGLSGLSRRSSTYSTESMGSTIGVETPVKTERNRETISPSGNVPIDMVKLLND